MNRGNYIDFWGPLQSNKELPSMFCMILQTDAANLNLFSASKRALQTLLQSLRSSFCDEVMVRETLAVFSISSLNRRNETVQNSLHPQTDTLSFEFSSRRKKIYFFLSLILHLYEESVWSLWGGESPPDRVQGLGDS